MWCVLLPRLAFLPGGCTMEKQRFTQRRPSQCKPLINLSLPPHFPWKAEEPSLPNFRERLYGFISLSQNFKGNLSCSFLLGRMWTEAERLRTLFFNVLDATELDVTVKNSPYTWLFPCIISKNKIGHNLSHTFMFLLQGIMNLHAIPMTVFPDSSSDFILFYFILFYFILFYFLVCF